MGHARTCATPFPRTACGIGTARLLRVPGRRTYVGMKTRKPVVRALIAAFAMTAGAIAGGGAATAAPKQINIAYMSFAVANSYDIPMLDAARKVARSNNVKLTVFDANNDAQLQYTQLQNAISSKKFQGIIIQPIYGVALIPLVNNAIKQGIKVVNIDQIMGSNFKTDKAQVKGLSANIVFNPVSIGTALGGHVLSACQGKATCKVGWLWSYKATPLDTTMRSVFDAAIAKGSGIQVIESSSDHYWNKNLALSVATNMLTANSDIDVFVGPDQAIQGAEIAVSSRGKQPGKDVKLIGYGGSAYGIGKVRLGEWHGTVMQAPASTGRLGMQALIRAIKTGKNSGALNPIASFPDKGVVTKKNASKFKGEWPA
jgi:ribose transport system substrate-binding protein